MVLYVKGAWNMIFGEFFENGILGFTDESWFFFISSVDKFSNK